MKENLLYFIWKLRLFSNKELLATNGQSIEIISVGTANNNQGPDFLNSKIKIAQQLWVGNVEMHINSSDWYIHNHEIDENYDSVILHVVWEHDVEIFRKTNKAIVTLELKNYISNTVLENYEALFKNEKHWINCEKNIDKTDRFILNNWIERLYFERLEHKSKQIEAVFKQTNNNWEATLFIILAKNFGLKINAEAFLNFANSFDFSIVRKVGSNPKQLEALFFGQAGLLFDEFNESVYYNELKKEYEYLQVKFKLIPISKQQIQFFRLRPNNFPTIRLSQLATLYNLHQNLFSKLMAIEGLEDFYNLLTIETSNFWKTHYTFEKESKKSAKKLTNSFVDLLLVNTIIPLKFMYLKTLGTSNYSSVLEIIAQIKPEKNTIISNFNNLKIKSKNAFESQALLQLKNEYCNKQLCLQCAIGKELLKS